MKLPTDYLQQHKEKLMAILQLPPRDYAPETFHELRVEIKKLRAVIALLRTVAPAYHIHQRGLNALRII
jgi:CHAD domain-containing protein